MKMCRALAVLMLLGLAATAMGQQEGPAHTVERATVSRRPNPIPTTQPYGSGRDWQAHPFRLAVVLVEFADVKHAPAHDAAFYQRLVVERGGPPAAPTTKPTAGSLANWYAGQSHGAFVLTGTVFDWVAIGETYHGVHGMTRHEAEQRYLRAALAQVRRRDGAHVLDGYDGWFFIHAGPIASPSTNILWSHRWHLDGTRYLTTFETESMNVSCHEFGHMLGLPDLYAKPGERQGVGPWCAMSTGFRGDLPGSLCAWSKARLGWCQPTVIDPRTPQRLVLRPIETNPQDAVLVPLNDHDGTGAEFLLLENRGGIRNDVGRPAGLLVWRITRDVDRDGQPLFNLTLRGPDDDAPARQHDGADEQLRSVTTRARDRPAVWPSATHAEYRLPPATDRQGVTIRGIRRTGDDVTFEVTAD